MLLLSGCGGPPPLGEVKAGVTICANGSCGPASQYTSDSILAGIHNLFRYSEGEIYHLCEANPVTRDCKDDGVSHFVQGGPIPGIGTYLQGTIVDAAVVDPKSRTVSATLDTSLKFIGTPLITSQHLVTASVHTPDRITLVEEDYYANWMMVGNGFANFTMAVDHINLDRGELGGFYRMSYTGTGIGGGSGYTVIRFHKAMAAGADWLQPETSSVGNREDCINLDSVAIRCRRCSGFLAR